MIICFFLFFGVLVMGLCSWMMGLCLCLISIFFFFFWCCCNLGLSYWLLGLRSCNLGLSSSLLGWIGKNKNKL